MSSEEEKIRAILDKAAIDALGKQLGKPEGTAHATVTVTDATIDVLVEFTPSSAPIPPAAYHNTSWPPITSEGIQEAAKRLRRLSLRLKNAPIDYTHKPIPLDIDIRDESHGPGCGCDDCEEGRLLATDAIGQYKTRRGKWVREISYGLPCGHAIHYTIIERKHVSNFESRVILLDGTIIREWGPK